MKNSIGNITEILDLLDSDKYTGIQIEQNYYNLVDRWGEWEIISGTGISVRYINISNALFSGAMITFSTLTIISLFIAILFGKIVFPLLAKHFKNANDEMVDMATLKSAAKIEQISSREEWF